jgi:membrane associated rhomboid family serine protease
MRGSVLDLRPIGEFDVGRAIYGFQVWRFFTYQFLHADFFHILFNMIGLFFFGPLLEQWWGRRRFLAFYLLCGMCGSLIYATLVIGAPSLIFDLERLRAIGLSPAAVPLIGASGAVFGILAGCATLFPHQRVQLLFPPIPMSMRTMALIFLGIAALSVIAGSANAGGEAAHLGGALLGWLLCRNAGWLNWADRVSPAGFPGAVRDGINEGRYRKKVERERATEAEVDRILAKVQASGLQSLSKKEKRTLNQASEAKRKA